MTKRDFAKRASGNRGVQSRTGGGGVRGNGCDNKHLARLHSSVVTAKWVHSSVPLWDHLSLAYGENQQSGANTPTF